MHAARFVTGDYKLREPGSMTAILQRLGWESLQQRRATARLVRTCNYVPQHHQQQSRRGAGISIRLTLRQEEQVSITNQPTSLN